MLLGGSRVCFSIAWRNDTVLPSAVVVCFRLVAFRRSKLLSDAKSRPTPCTFVLASETFSYLINLRRYYTERMFASYTDFNYGMNWFLAFILEFASAVSAELPEPQRAILPYPCVGKHLLFLSYFLYF